MADATKAKLELLDRVLVSALGITIPATTTDEAHVTAIEAAVTAKIGYDTPPAKSLAQRIANIEIRLLRQDITIGNYDLSAAAQEARAKAREKARAEAVDRGFRRRNATGGLEDVF
jgi:hypothetical protein